VLLISANNSAWQNLDPVSDQQACRFFQKSRSQTLVVRPDDG
jgi:hypothetical protein